MKRDARDAPKSITLGFEADCVTQIGRAHV